MRRHTRDLRSLTRASAAPPPRPPPSGPAVARALKDADGDPRAVLEAVLAEDPRRLKRVGGVLTVDPGVAGSIPPDVLDHRRVR